MFSSLIFAGMLLIMLGFLLIMLGSMGSMFGNRDEGEASKTEVRGGGLIMIGPIPLILGSDNKSVQTLMVLAIVLMVLYFVVFK